jgi:hypothetical protein
MFRSMRLSVDGDRDLLTGLVKEIAFVGVWLGRDGFGAIVVSGLCRKLDLMMKTNLTLRHQAENLSNYLEILVDSANERH